MGRRATLSYGGGIAGRKRVSPVSIPKEMKIISVFKSSLSFGFQMLSDE
jgi:hypothetical protein